MNLDITIVGLQPWDLEIGSNCRDIALELSKQHRVLYFNRPMTRSDKFLNRENNIIKKYLDVLNGKSNSLLRINNNLFVYYPKIVLEPTSWIRHEAIFNYLNKFNSRRIAKELLKAHEMIKFKRDMLFNDNDFINYAYIYNYIDFEKTIFYIRDHLTTQKYFGMRKNLESLTISKYDKVFTNSIFLRDYAKEKNPSSYFIGQGCDFDNFLETEEIPLPDDLSKIPTPIIGYAGALLSNRLDLELLEYIASYNEWSIVLVGPQDASFKSSRLHLLNNVHFLNSKPKEDIASYITHFDVCINPQSINDFTIGNYPRKIDEYLVLGKPVVARHTLSMDYFKDYVYLSRDKKSFAQKINKAINENNQELRILRKEFALSHSWENSIKTMFKNL